MDRVPFRPLSRPGAADIVALGASRGLRLSDDEAGALEPVLDRMLSTIESLASEPRVEPPRPAGGPRAHARRPRPGEDPLNAFIHFCDVATGAAGPLDGYRVGIKDNLDVAGIPTTNGAEIPPYVPESDAVVVERILAAGGRIVGKLNLDCFSAGATGESSHFGPARNPIDPTRIPGGSSSGAGAALGSGAVDLAIGGDQAGSARLPAALCGVVAIKATHGLVPSFGMANLDHTIDGVCPMARTVEDTALLLSVVAGADWRDPQWTRGPAERGFSDSSWRRKDLRGLRVGVVQEALAPDICEPDVIDRTREAAMRLAAHGAEVQDISIPAWSIGHQVVEMLLCHLAGGMVWSEGESYGHLGLIDPVRQRAFATARRRHAELLPAYFKIWILMEAHLHDRESNRTHPVLHNLRLRVRREVDAALAHVDLLLTPTSPTTAPPLLGEGATAEDLAARVLDHLPFNTSVANLTGNPAVAVPSGSDRQGLPTSAQLMARRWQDGLALAAAGLLESDLAVERPLGSAVPRAL